MITEKTYIEKAKKSSQEIGIIYPPPDIRAIIDKTAIFVKKNGIAFEKKILKQQIGDEKFNFLQSTDPYHSYYKTKIEKPLEDIGESSGSITEIAKKKSNEKTSIGFLEESSLNKIGNCITTMTTPIFQEPFENGYTVDPPENITILELETIKLSARYTARNGKAFLSGLFQREQNNPLFAFMRPSNSLYPYFTGLIDAYQKVLMPPRGIKEILFKNFEDHDTILTRCLKKLEYNMGMDLHKNLDDELLKNDHYDLRAADWYDFTVVENIEFLDDEDEALPAPLTQREIIFLNKAQTENAETLENRTYQPNENNTFDNPKIMEHVQSPMTGEIVAINKVSEHMKTNLLNPDWKEQRRIMLNNIKKNTKASEDEITLNVFSIAKHRPDLLGAVK